MLKQKRIWIPILSVLVIAMGCGLFYGQKVANQEPVKVYKPVDVSKPATPKPPPPGETAESGHWHGDEWHAEPHDAHAPAEVSESTPLVSEGEAPPPIETAEAPPAVAAPIETDWVNPTSTSSNPLFADGVPEHLQCPPELIEVYTAELDPEMRERIYQITDEILEKYNPNRPLTEVWDAFMAAEKWYHANADPDGAGISMAANRIDWQWQIGLDFPEVIVLAQEDVSRSFNMRRVELGQWSADFNVNTLSDGRKLREDDDKKYVITRSFYTEKENGGYTSRTSTVTFGPSNGDPNAEVIEINLDTITDSELEALQGWDYTINPYTTGAYKLGDNR